MISSPNGTPSFSRPNAADAVSPPPGCPAHASGGDGLVNLFSPEAVADPDGTYERLRAEHGPVAPVRLADGLPAWLVLGYRENLEVARTPTRFTRDSRVWNLAREGKVPSQSPLLPMTEWKPLIRFFDGDEHRRVRGALNHGLGGFNRRGIRRHVTRFSNDLIDRFCARGHADLVTEFSQQLPMLVMTRLFGMPDDAGAALVKASQDLVTGASTAVRSNEFIVAQLRKLVADKRAAPGSDLASWLLEHPAGLSDTEAMQNLRVTLVIGNETTVSLISSALRIILTDLRFRATLAGGHTTLADAVEQILWDEPPFRTLVGRWATADTEVGGQKIKAGDLMLLGLAAGNVDPSIRPDPSAPLFGNRSHLSFGGGAHECPGQDISRSIAETGIDTLLNRLPDLALAVPESELRWDSAWVTRHLATLPASFSACRPSSPERKRANDHPDSAVLQPEPQDAEAAQRPSATDGERPASTGSGTPWAAIRRLLRPRG